MNVSILQLTFHPLIKKAYPGLPFFLEAKMMPPVLWLSHSLELDAIMLHLTTNPRNFVFLNWYVKHERKNRNVIHEPLEGLCGGSVSVAVSIGIFPD